MFVAGETDQVEFVTDEEESIRAAESGCRCVSTSSLRKSFYHKCIDILLLCIISVPVQYPSFHHPIRPTYSNGPLRHSNLTRLLVHPLQSCINKLALRSARHLAPKKQKLPFVLTNAIRLTLVPWRVSWTMSCKA